MTNLTALSRLKDGEGVLIIMNYNFSFLFFGHLCISNLDMSMLKFIFFICPIIHNIIYILFYNIDFFSFSILIVDLAA